MAELGLKQVYLFQTQDSESVKAGAFKPKGLSGAIKKDLIPQTSWDPCIPRYHALNCVLHNPQINMLKS